MNFLKKRVFICALVIAGLSCSGLPARQAQADTNSNPPIALLDISTPTSFLIAGQPAQINLSAISPNPITSWQFTISTKVGFVLVDRNGNGAPPLSIDWNTLADDGTPMLGGTWSAQLTIVLDNGQRISQSKDIYLAYESWNSPISPAKLSTSPLVAGVGGTFRIDYPYSPNTTTIANAWYLELDDQYSHRVYLNGNFQTSPQQTLASMPHDVAWNGDSTDISGGPTGKLPAGDYTLVVEGYLGEPGLSWQVSRATLPITVLAEAPTPTPTPTPIPDPASKLHPVLLIHGLNDYPTTWGPGGYNYISLLNGLGYPDNYISAYHYTGTGVGKDGYNNQGDIPQMAAGMADAVNKLRDASLARGGDGRVDIIAHSMGGLIARQYIKDHPTDNHIAKVIAIGTPFQGSFWMEASSTIDKFIPGGEDLKNQIIKSSFGNLDLSQPSEQEMTPSSTFLDSLATPDPSIQYYALYGNITVSSRIQLFDIAIKSTPLKHSDLVVASQSASDIPAGNKVEDFAFDDERYLDMFIHQHGIEYVYTINQTSVNNVLSSPYYHNNLPSQATVKARVIKSLKDE